MASIHPLRSGVLLFDVSSFSLIGRTWAPPVQSARIEEASPIAIMPCRLGHVPGGGNDYLCLVLSLQLRKMYYTISAIP